LQSESCDVSFCVRHGVKARSSDAIFDIRLFLWGRSVCVLLLNAPRRSEMFAASVAMSRRRRSAGMMTDITHFCRSSFKLAPCPDPFDSFYNFWLPTRQINCSSVRVGVAFIKVDIMSDIIEFLLLIFCDPLCIPAWSAFMHSCMLARLQSFSVMLNLFGFLPVWVGFCSWCAQRVRLR
jgi:hypothetical protein